MFARPTLTRVVLAAAALLALAPAAGRAGDWHRDGLLFCSECHTSHNSADGAPMRYDLSTAPAAYLLRAADEISLCLACHDGSNLRAPDVLAPVGYVANPSSGSFPSRDGSGTGKGHRLVRSSPQRVPLGSKDLILTCASCHAPHGNANYRNLRTRPGGGTGADLVITVDQVKRADGANPAEVYGLANLTHRAGMNAWCIDCHDRAPAEHGEHPVDRTIYGSTRASYAQWLALTGPRLPVENPTDPVVPSTDDRLSCVTCHYAHGDASSELRAPPSGSGDLCSQCHVQ